MTVVSTRDECCRCEALLLDVSVSMLYCCFYLCIRAVFGLTCCEHTHGRSRYKAKSNIWSNASYVPTAWVGNEPWISFHPDREISSALVGSMSRFVLLPRNVHTQRYHRPPSHHPPSHYPSITPPTVAHPSHHPPSHHPHITPPTAHDRYIPIRGTSTASERDAMAEGIIRIDAVLRNLSKSGGLKFIGWPSGATGDKSASGMPEEIVARFKKTSLNPVLLDAAAFWLVMVNIPSLPTVPPSSRVLKSLWPRLQQCVKQSITVGRLLCVCACVYGCARARVCACVRVCVCACACVRVYARSHCSLHHCTNCVCGSPEALYVCLLLLTPMHHYDCAISLHSGV